MIWKLSLLARHILVFSMPAQDSLAALDLELDQSSCSQNILIKLGFYIAFWSLSFKTQLKEDINSVFHGKRLNPGYPVPLLLNASLRWNSLNYHWRVNAVIVLTIFSAVKAGYSAVLRKKIHPLKITEFHWCHLAGAFFGHFPEETPTVPCAAIFPEEGDGRLPPADNFHPSSTWLSPSSFTKRIKPSSNVRGKKQHCLLLPAKSHHFHSTCCCPKENLTLPECWSQGKARNKACHQHCWFCSLPVLHHITILSVGWTNELMLINILLSMSFPPPPTHQFWQFSPQIYSMSNEL